MKYVADIQCLADGRIMASSQDGTSQVWKEVDSEWQKESWMRRTSWEKIEKVQCLEDGTVMFLDSGCVLSGFKNFITDRRFVLLRVLVDLKCDL